jgi:tyrosyl-tRNA synthetase
MRLAREIVALYCSEQAAQDAEESFVNTFQKKEEPTEWDKVAGMRGEKLSEVLMAAGVLKSKSEFRRLVEEGAVHLWPEGTISDPEATLQESLKLKIGKRRFVHLQAN